MRFKLKCAELLAEERRQLTAQFMRARREAQVGSPQLEVLPRRALRRWRVAARRVAWIRQSDTFPPSAGAHGPWLARWMGGWVGGVGGWLAAAAWRQCGLLWTCRRRLCSQRVLLQAEFERVQKARDAELAKVSPPFHPNAKRASDRAYSTRYLSPVGSIPNQ